MKNLFLLFIALLFVACGDKKKDGEQQEKSQKQGEQTEQSQQVEIKKTAESIDYIFKPSVVKPVDESKKNPELKRVLSDLLKVIDDKDVDGLKSFLDGNILVSLGGEKGWNEFAAFWDLDLNPEKSMVWQELKNAIILGGTFDKQNKNYYTTPYLYSNFEYDAYEYAAITGEKVNIRDKASTKGKVVTQLNYDVVKVFGNDASFSQFQEKIGNETHYWLKIQMADGKTGFVWGKFCRTSIDYRATFAKVRDEGWKMTAFVAGD